MFSEISSNSKYDRNIGESLMNSIASNDDGIKPYYADENFKNTSVKIISNIWITIRFGHG